MRARVRRVVGGLDPYLWSGSQSQSSVTQSNFTNPICAKCGKRHPGECCSGSNICYGCGQPGHIQRNCPSVRQGTGGNQTQSVNSSVPHNNQTQAGRVPARSGNTSGGPNRLYALIGCQDIDNRTDVVTGILTVFSFDVYALMDPGSTLSYVTPYVARKFGIAPEKLKEPFEVSTPVGFTPSTPCLTSGISCATVGKLRVSNS
ncbi:uncharacterized protein LOC132644459 [Lycium barbarum]|uniref:uncharacterized protein LOC132644459 n=1 Tax=Lycium barbarum TaxID=112863 RepID=UPI00293E83C9|nr:uncharacterized protein LOC132644459 [Lycium barbarum]